MGSPEWIIDSHVFYGRTTDWTAPEYDAIETRDGHDVVIAPYDVRVPAVER